MIFSRLNYQIHAFHPVNIFSIQETKEEKSLYQTTGYMKPFDDTTFFQASPIMLKHL